MTFKMSMLEKLCSGDYFDFPNFIYKKNEGLMLYSSSSNISSNSSFVWLGGNIKSFGISVGICIGLFVLIFYEN